VARSPRLRASLQQLHKTLSAHRAQNPLARDRAANLPVVQPGQPAPQPDQSSPQPVPQSDMSEQPDSSDESDN
jgi:hypothetical protein